jgi:carbonic anhydrase
MYHKLLLVRVIALATSIVLALLAPTYAADPASSNKVTSDAALRQLLEGNVRFSQGKATNPRRRPEDFRAVSKEQHPLAVVIACADSRVSPELLFDAGVGDLFVIREAGNVVRGAGVMVDGSIEYAIAELNVPLVIVLGHTNCGAVKAAVTHLDSKEPLPGSINGLVELIKPAVKHAQGRQGDVYDNVTRENVRAGVEKVKSLQPIVAPRVKAGAVKVVGGVYDLETGAVKILQAEAE